MNIHNSSDYLTTIALNAEQKLAFETFGHCVVLAPPGSGKTGLLAEKCAWTATHSLGPLQSVVAITLTNAAVDELRDRLKSIGRSLGRSVVVTTVHSFALNHILRRFAVAVGSPELLSLEIAEENEADRKLEECIEEVYQNSYQAKDVKEQIKRGRRSCLGPDQSGHISDQMRSIVIEYEKRLRRASMMDFDMVVHAAVKMVEENPLVRRVLQSKFPFLMVDEYQDLAPGLHRIVSALAFEEGGSTLFAVGDPDQAIYGWTGTDPALLMNLSSRPDVDRIDLKWNYRNSAAVSQAAQRILGKTTIESQIYRQDGEVRVHKVPEGFGGQISMVGAEIGELLNKGVPPRECGVLVLTNNEREDAIAILSDLGLPVEDLRRFGGNSEVARAVMRLAAWITNGGDGGGITLSEILMNWNRVLGAGVSGEAESQIVRMALDASPSDPAYSLVTRLFDMARQPASEFRMTRQRLREFSDLEKTFRPSVEPGSLSIQELAESWTDRNAVRVVTLTSSKGLEFDHVFIVGLEQGRIPFYTSVAGSREYEEEKRKLYVAVTRSRHTVSLLFSGWYLGGGYRRENGPSEFLRHAGVVVN